MISDQTSVLASSRVSRLILKLKQLLLCHWFLVVLIGCSSIPERNPLPVETGFMGEIPGIPNARIWSDEPPPDLEQWFALSKEQLQKRYPKTFGVPHSYLAISGGGQNGAYGAGLLVGWTASGTRPEFTDVTGISTGAIIAPFAFLGPEYDDELEEIYTSYSTNDLVQRNSIFSIVTGASIYRADPLYALISNYITQDMIEEIAEEHRQGRSLSIGTTNLEALRPVEWDLGKIANSEHPNKVELIRKIILASASIPAVFPPVLFQVNYQGEVFDEIHVDGGTSSQIYLYPVGVDLSKALKHMEVPEEPDVFLIRNDTFDTGHETIQPRIFTIFSQSINSLIKTQGVGDLYRIYYLSQRDGLDFHLTAIGTDFESKSKELFDREYMNHLFQYGYDRGKNGIEWRKSPPEME